MQLNRTLQWCLQWKGRLMLPLVANNEIYFFKKEMSKNGFPLLFNMSKLLKCHVYGIYIVIVFFFLVYKPSLFFCVTLEMISLTVLVYNYSSWPCNLNLIAPFICFLTLDISLISHWVEKFVKECCACNFRDFLFFSFW